MKLGRIGSINQEYFSWLYKQIGNQKHGYNRLCQELHNKPFRWSVSNDDNRCADGLELRDTFVEEKNLDENHVEVAYWLKAECTVFEVLVALANRMNYFLYDLNHQEDHTSKWFLEMLTNLGLDNFDDRRSQDDRFSPVTEAQIDELLEKFLSRAYDFYGRGGLFPLKRRPLKDQTDVEIWYQLMNYLNENYGL